MTSQTLFSLETLHTVSGASMAILLIVQLIKGLPIIKLIPTKCLSILLGILLFSITSPLPKSLDALTVILLNGLLCGSTAIGSWHMISDFSNKEVQK